MKGETLNMNRDFEEFLRWEDADRDIIKVKRLYIDIAGDLVAGILLSQIVYWHLPSQRNGQSKLKVQKDGKLWLAKGRNEWWDECRISVKQFDRAIGILIEKGIVEKQTFKFNGSPTIHLRLVPEVLMGYIKQQLTRGENGNSPKGKIQIDQTGRSITEITTETTINNNKTFPQTDYSEDFQKFWEAYPKGRRVEKKRAYRCWKTRLREGYKPDDMITAAKNYAAWCERNKTEPRFIKHPSTFLGPDIPFEEYLKASEEQPVDATTATLAYYAKM